MVLRAHIAINRRFGSYPGAPHSTRSTCGEHFGRCTFATRVKHEVYNPFRNSNPQAKASSRFDMHACLNVDEIVRFVACELIASEANATVVSLACCCKDFQEPVLDALWETQDRLTPLLKCFPQGVWEEKVSQVTKLIFSTLE